MSMLVPAKPSGKPWRKNLPGDIKPVLTPEILVVQISGDRERILGREHCLCCLVPQHAPVEPGKLLR